MRFFLFLTLFFPLFSYAQDYQPAKVSQGYYITCMGANSYQFSGSGFSTTSFVDAMDNCMEGTEGATVQHGGYTYTLTECSAFINSGYRYACTARYTDYTGHEQATSYLAGVHVEYWEGSNTQCPPDGYPDYTDGPRGIDSDPDGAYCFKPLLSECPEGHFKYKVGDPLQCVPITCSSAGTMKDVMVNGSMIGDSGGIYCDGQCAYSIDPANQSFWSGAPAGNSFLSGVSLGGVCGQGPGDNWGLPDADHTSCSFYPNEAGSTSVSCDSAVTDPDPDGGDASTTPEDFVDAPTDQPQELDPCVAGDADCFSGNIIKSIQNANLEQLKQEADAHNKAIEHNTEMTEILRSNIIRVGGGINSSTNVLGAKLDAINDTLATGLKIEEGGIGSGGDNDEEIEGAVSGAPDGTELGTGYDDALSQYLDTINDIGNQNLPESPPGLGSAWTIAGGTCSGYNYTASIGGRDVPMVFDDHCQPYHDVFHPVMRWVLYTLTALYIFHIVSRGILAA